MDKKKFYTQDEAKDILIGEIGTRSRDNYEANLDMFLIGDTIRRTRLEKKLTQEDLGKLIGVQKAQVSKIENGKNLTISTIIKVFKALGVSVKLDIDNGNQKIALC